MTELPPPLEGRESAARPWEVLLKATVYVMAVSGLIVALEFFVDVPAGLFALAALGLIVGVVAVYVAGVAIGRMRGVPWYNAFTLAFRLVREAICAFF